MQTRSKDRFCFKSYSKTGQKIPKETTPTNQTMDEIQTTKPKETTPPPQSTADQFQSMDTNPPNPTEIDQPHPTDETKPRDPLPNIDTTDSTLPGTLKELYLKMAEIHDEILDTMEDNPIEMITPDQMNTCCDQLKALRKDLKRADRNIKTHLSEDDYQKLYAKPVTMLCSDIAKYIAKVNKFNKDGNDAINKTQTDADKQKADLIVNEINRSAKFLNASMKCTFSLISNDDLKQRKSLLETQTKELKEIASRLQELIYLRPCMKTYNELKSIYSSLQDKKEEYDEKINQELKIREIEKLEAFNKRRLNIKLSTFKGYDSSTDIYTFIDEFKKLYTDSVPQSLQAELVKNNHLSGQALSLVQSIDCISEIWERLKSVFGDKQILLQHKLQDLYKIEHKSRDPLKIIDFLSQITNAMRDLMSLAYSHDIENELYFSDALNQITQMLGDQRMMRWLNLSCEEPKRGKSKWKQLIDFLEKEMKVHQQKAAIQKSSTNKQSGNQQKQGGGKHGSSSHHSNLPTPPSDPVCTICNAAEGTNEHVSTSGPKSTRIMQYYTCKEFATKSPAERLKTLNSKGFCTQCLFPGANSTTGKHSDGRCQHEFGCPHPSHQQNGSNQVKKLHVLLCEDHKSLPSNQQLLKRYVDRFIKSPKLPAFARQIHLYKASNNHCNERGIYLLQRIHVNGKDLVIFFDNGCSDFVVSHEAIQLLGSHAEQLSSEPISIGGVGQTQAQSTLGTYRVTIPLHDGTEVSLIGACLEKITETFPTYPLDQVERDINHHYSLSNQPGKLPKLAPSIGGDVHLMIGVKHLSLHPIMKFQLETGLAIYESKFINSTGGRGLVGGPHPIFTTVHQNFMSTSMTTFFTDQFISIRNRPDAPLLGFKPTHPAQPIDTEVHLSTAMRVFEEVEAAGSEISYRCPKCRECKDCKHDSNEFISIKEEVEQTIINKSVTIDFDKSITTAHLPFTADPTKRLSNNREKAMRVYQQQIKKLNNPKNFQDKEDILESEGKLHQLGYVDYVKNLSPEIQAKLQTSPVQYTIPWRAVWKGNSISTPCRIVFDASQPTSTGESLNDILAKGTNNLNKLQEIFLRWTVLPVAIATDIKKMYNTIKLNEDHWTYQRYLWHPTLEPGQEPEEKVIKTLIYGVKSSGNQAEFALRQVAKVSQTEFPKTHNVVHEDVYVDDCLTGEVDRQKAHNLSQEFEIVLNRGGFQLKGVAFSGEEPPSSLSEDNKTIPVAGMKWFVEEDMLSLHIGELNFAKKSRGKKPLNLQNIIPSRLTRRHCASKVAELFDLTGKIAPLIASMKIDLQDLLHHQLDWDDQIPDSLRPLWESNFELMKEIGQLKFKRAVIPEDAVNTDINTIDFGDASQSMACVAIYARFLRRNGEYSSQLIFARTRTVKDLTQPRAELYAALINCHTGEIVRRSISKWHRSSIKLTDSQIVLHWIDNDEKPLKKWVRNRVVEIKRFTSNDQWHYVDTSNMLADLGTRRGSKTNEVDKDSKWINGHDWMHLDQHSFPIKSAKMLKLTEREMEEVQKEVQINIHHVECPTKEFEKRYTFSNYLLDPNYRSFTTVTRIMAYVIRYFNCLRSKKYSTSTSNIKEMLPLTDEEISAAEHYYFKKAADELRHFLPPKKFEPITTSKDGILLYNGRILPSNSVTIVGRYTEAMLDLTSSTFCVPVIDKNSPVAFSIASDIHWNHKDVQHAGIETTLRHIMKKTYIIEGRSLVKLIKKSCQRCRFLNKRTIEAAMGPLPEACITIAPSFYNTQFDLSGPYKAINPSNKRTTIKVWLVVYCCCVTSAIFINVMDDYSTTAFIQSFTRFASRSGFPNKVFCDEGTQLIKGSKDMRLSFTDIKSRLHKDHQITFETCPVGAHNMNGKVERKIKEVNASLERTVHNEKLSILQWETVCSMISNSINNLPIAIGSVIDVENMDLLTPNRLLLGRNNDRSPSGNFIISSNPTKILDQNSRIYDAWFESWLLNHVPKLMSQSKWFNHERNLQVGDVVLFTKVDSKLSKSYTYGIISNVEVGDDGKVRCVIVKYRNENEKVSRETRRSVRNLVLIHSVDDCDIMKEFGDIAKNVDINFKLNN